MKENIPYRIIISGGGTGGHIFPAIAIANALRKIHTGTEILFIGAKGRMEMDKVPKAGYPIEGLWISGFQRKTSVKNILVPIKIIVSIIKSISIIRKMKPHAVVGVGGYSSGPVLYAATKCKIPTLIQEQNSYAGLTNRILSKKVDKICVAYEHMEVYFPKDKIIITGNPVRQDINKLDEKRASALKRFGFSANRKTLLVVGGSLGARTINESLAGNIGRLCEQNIQVIWQTGKLYYGNALSIVGNDPKNPIKVFDFIKDMDLAYSAADIVISRAGAIAISELCIAGKPVILVPSPNVAEDHQTKNARYLLSNQAAIMVTDADAGNALIDEAIKLLFDENLQASLRDNIGKLAKPDAALMIANEVLGLINEGQ